MNIESQHWMQLQSPGQQCDLERRSIASWKPCVRSVSLGDRSKSWPQTSKSASAKADGHGLYRLTAEDLRNGARHEDAVCTVTFPVDIHSTDPQKNKAIVSRGFRSQPYDIPYRALVAADVPNLLFAGRCISGDFVAHSSYRVTGNAAAIGEAAGVAAALAATHNGAPKDVPWSKIASELQRLRSQASS